jgi:predicted transcriptional regulator
MKTIKVQSMASLRKEMLAVVRGDKAAPVGSGGVSFNSLQAVADLLSNENRRLLSIIRKRKPQSVAELAGMSGRSQPNVTRALKRLETARFVVFKADGRRKIPQVAVGILRMQIDPCSHKDTVIFARPYSALRLRQTA